jgi:uncharacterized protein (DUF2267 family)
MASTVSSADAGRRTAELIRQQQEAQRKSVAAAQRQASTPLQTLKPRVELFRNDSFTAAPGRRAPVQLGADVRTFGTQVSAAVPRASGPQVSGVASLRFDDEKVSEAQRRVLDAGSSGGTVLAEQLRDEDLSVEDRRELIDRIVNGGNAAELLSNFDHIEEERNYDYDDAATVATAVADAYQAGVITDEELRTLAEDLGPERSAELAAQLALDPANTGVGGVVEAFGRQADALGQDQAAAIAFSSSQALIDANLPTAADQRAAFEDVSAYLDSQDRDDLSNEQRAFFSIAAGNAVRLSANGNGWSDSELQDFVKDLGPSLAGEVVARTRNTPGDSERGGAVEALGLAAREISRGDVGDDREEWEVNSAVALTASPELIDAHLNGTEALQAFQTLTEAADGQYDTAKDAQEDGYSLLRFPEIVEGAAALFEARTDEIVEASIRSGEGVLDQGHLQRFLQSTAFSPFSSPEVKQQVQGALTDWTENHVQIGADQNEGDLAHELGEVLGIVQNAADSAVDRVGDDEAARVEAENEAKDFIASLGSSIVGTALGAYNPLLGAVGGPLAQELIEAVLPQGDVEAARAQAESDFRALLEQQGTRADLGQALKQVQEEYLRRLQDAIGNQLQRGDLTQEQRNKLEATSLVLGNIQEGLDDGYGDARPT